VRTDLFALHAAIEETHWWFRGRRSVVGRIIRQLVPQTPSALILDVGCGTGATAASFATDYRVIGIDTSSHGIEWARARYPTVHFVHGTAPDDVRSACASASAMLLMDVAEHVPDDFWFVSTLLAALSPGAHLLVTVPADESLWSEHDVSFGHYRRYDVRRLRRVWSGLPVTERLLSFFNARLYPVVRGVRAVSRWRGRARGSGQTDFVVPRPVANAALTRALAGEGDRIVRAVDADPSAGSVRYPAYRRGVSLIAVLRREHGEIRPRRRPDDVPADLHQP
jgi:SAM-dependent methyltransferase